MGAEKVEIERSNNVELRAGVEVADNNVSADNDGETGRGLVGTPERLGERL